MVRGWEVLLNDGTVLREADTDWKKVPKLKIKKLTLHFDGRKWELENKPAYFVGKIGSAVPGDTNVTVEQRYIGYYDGNGSKIYFMVDERTGACRQMVKDVSK